MKSVFDSILKKLFGIKSYYSGHCGKPPHCGQPPCENCNGGFFVRIWIAFTLLVKAIFSPFYALMEFLKVKETRRKNIANKTLVLSGKSSSKTLKIAYVSVYNTPCGISTYNEDLLKELGYYADIRVFAEYADSEKSIRIENDPSWVYRCWDRNEYPKRNLLKAIDAWGPDLVHFSHEYGFFPRAFYFTNLVSSLKARAYTVLATMHSVYDHLDKVVSESCVPNLMVHTFEGKACLVKKGISPEAITVIPHGSNIFCGTPDQPQLLPDLWNTWNSQHTIYQPGFMFGYKGHMRMLGVVAKLKEKYPDVHYIVQGSENPNTMTEHDQLYKDLISECNRLEINDNVTINRGFAERDVLISHIRTVKCCVLPYANHPAHDVRATSGIARMILGTQTPLVVSGVHLFDDLEGIVPRVRDDQELYDAIDLIFSDASVKDVQLEKRTAFLRKTSWSTVAMRIASLYQDLIQ